MKTLAIRLEDDLHAQLSVLAQLESRTITDEIRQAIADYINTKRSHPDLTARAEAVLGEIEQEAASRRSAIAALFGSPDLESEPAVETAPANAPEPPSTAGSRSRRANPKGNGGQLT